MFSALASKHKFQSKKGETLLLQIDIYRSNIIVPKSIQWKYITLPKDWIPVGATQPKHI